MAYNFRDNLKLKTEYLRELYAEENERQNIVESKNAQVLGQSGVILSLVGLFIPMYIEKLISTNFIVQIILILVFLFTLTFYFLTIFVSSKYLNAHNYNYRRKDADTVNNNYAVEDDFYIEEIYDLLEIIENNSQVNNRKVADLKKAYSRFRTANVLTALLSLFLLASIFFIPKKSTPTMNMHEPVKIEGFQGIIEQLKKERKIMSCDTIILYRK
jgi:rod shape-determining protein MreD